MNNIKISEDFFNKKSKFIAGSNSLKSFDKKILNKQISFLKQSEKWNYRKMQKWQILKIRKLLTYVESNVPYYNKLFKKIDFNPEKLKNLKELKKIPYLTKDLIKKNYSQLISKKVRKSDLVYITSGGSTGSPMPVLMDKKINSINRANTHYYLNVAGYIYGKYKSVRLHGDKIDEHIILNNKFWKKEKNRLNMSVYHIKKNTVHNYVNEINSFKPKYIHAYPSAIYLLIKYMKLFNLKFNQSIRSIFCDSETLYPWQKKFIKDYTNLKVFNVYGHTEGACIAITFPNKDGLHFLPQVGFIEFEKKKINSKKKRIHTEIVATGLNNYVFPLIRYKTGDICIHTAKNKLKKTYPKVKHIEGRLQEYIFDKNKNRVPVAPALFDYNFNWTGIDQFQIVQNKLAKIKFNLVIDRDFLHLRKKILKKVKYSFNEIFQKQFSIQTSSVKKIDRTIRGKYKYVIQKIK